MGCAQTSSKPKATLPEIESVSTATIPSPIPLSVPKPVADFLTTNTLPPITPKSMKTIVTKDSLFQGPLDEQLLTAPSAKEEVTQRKATDIPVPTSPKNRPVKPLEEPKPTDSKATDKGNISDSEEFIKVSPAKRLNQDEFEGVGSGKHEVKTGKLTARVVLARLEPEIIESETMKSFKAEKSSPLLGKPRVLELTTTVEASLNQKDSTGQEKFSDKKPDRVPNTESLFLANSGFQQSHNPQFRTSQLESAKGSIFEDVEGL